MARASRKPAVGLVFSEKAHQYRLDGKHVSGVTTLIKQGLPNEALKYWSAKAVAQWVADNPDEVDALRRMGRGPMVQALKEVPWQKRDTAGERGTEVHSYAERVVRDEDVDVPDELAGYVQSAVAFMDEWNIRPLIVERPLGHRAHWWAGTGDLFAEYTAPAGATLPPGVPNSGVLYGDHKTADSGIWPDCAFQFAAYTHAEFYVAEDGTEHPIPKVDFAAAIWLQPDRYELIPVRADDQVYREFRHISFVADAARRAKGNKTIHGYVGDPIAVDPWHEEQTA